MDEKLKEFVGRYSCRIGDDYRLIYDRRTSEIRQRWITLDDFAQAVASFTERRVLKGLIEEHIERNRKTGSEYVALGKIIDQRLADLAGKEKNGNN